MQEEVRLVRHFAFHVLMLLPVKVVKKRAGFWLQHVDGVPDLLHCCVKVATLQDPQVRLSCLACAALKLQSWQIGDAFFRMQNICDGCMTKVQLSVVMACAS